MPYERTWSRTYPGCIIFVLDQSGSMSDPFGGNQIGAGKQKCEWVATLLNRAINDLVKTNTSGSDIRTRTDIAILGYSNSSVNNALPSGLYGDFANLADLKNNPLRIETRTRKEMDDVGNVIEVPEYFQVWVEPVANGGTPMCAALSRAKDLAEQWASAHPSNYPPVVVHVTDGVSTDGDPTSIAKELMRVSTSDGDALLFNCHITDNSASEILFPDSDSHLSDQFAKMLFNISSIVPDSARISLMNVGITATSHARGFIFNGDASAIKSMFTFATIVDPNR